MPVDPTIVTSNINRSREECESNTVIPKFLVFILPSASLYQIITVDERI